VAVWRCEVSSCHCNSLYCSHVFAGGPRSAFGSAVACGILLGVFEGVGVLMSRVFSEQTRPQMAPRKQQYTTDFLLANACASTWRHSANISPFISVDSRLFYMIHLHSMFFDNIGEVPHASSSSDKSTSIVQHFDSQQRFSVHAVLFLPVYELLQTALRYRARIVHVEFTGRCRWLFPSV